MGKRNKKPDKIDIDRVIKKMLATPPPIFTDREKQLKRIEIAKQNSHPLVIRLNEEINPAKQQILIDKIANDCKKTLHYFVENYSSNLKLGFYKELIVEFADIFEVEEFCFLYLNRTKDTLKKLIIASLESSEIDNKTQEILTYIDSIESYEVSNILVFHSEIAFQNINLLGATSPYYVVQEFLKAFIDRES